MQITCPHCTHRLFYIMAQDDGSLEAYCAVHNHLIPLVNIPALTEAILGATKELTEDAEKLKVTVASVETGVTDTNLERIYTPATEATSAEPHPIVNVRRARASRGKEAIPPTL